MTPVYKTEPIPHAEFSRERRRWILRRNDEMSHRRKHASQRLAVVPSRNSEKIRNRQPPRTVQQSQRHAAPKTPATKVTLRQSFGSYVMVNHHLRQIHAPRTAGEKTSVKLLVLTGQQSFISTTEPRGVESNLFEYRSF